MGIFSRLFGKSKDWQEMDEETDDETEGVNYSNTPWDYGKLIDDPKIQQPFSEFLFSPDDKYDERLYDKYFEEAGNANTMSEKLRILKNGANEGCIYCHAELGKMYVTGEGVSVDYEQAERHLRKAARCGLPESMFYLGMVYAKTEDRVLEALDWLCKAAIRGEIASFRFLGMYSSNEVVKNQIEGRLSVYFKKVMEKEGTPGTDYRFLGCCVYLGLCCIRDTDKAQIYWMEGVESGDIYCRILAGNPGILAG